jgi:hypothetical protein
LGHAKKLRLSKFLKNTWFHAQILQVMGSTGVNLQLYHEILKGPLDLPKIQENSEISRHSYKMKQRMIPLLNRRTE